MITQKTQTNTGTEDEIPSMECTSPVSAHDVYVPDFLQSGYRPSHNCASPRTSKMVQTKLADCGFRPWGLDMAEELEASPEEKTPKKNAKIQRKRAQSMTSHIVSVKPSTSQNVQEYEHRPKKQKFLFEDTPIMHNEATRTAKITSETEAKLTEKAKKNKKSKQDKQSSRELDLDTPSTSQAVHQYENRTTKKQMLLFEDTPVTHREIVNAVIPKDTVVDNTVKPRKHSKNKVVADSDAVFRSCLDANTPSTSKRVFQEQPSTYKKGKNERIEFEVFPSDSLLDDTDTSNDEANEVQDTNNNRRKRAKSMELGSNLIKSLIDTPSTSKVLHSQDKHYKKMKRQTYLWDESMVEDYSETDQPVQMESRSQQRQRAKSVTRASTVTPNTSNRRQIEETPRNGNRPKKKVSFEAPAYQPSPGAIGRSVSVQRASQPQQTTSKEIQQRLENDNRPKDRLQRLEEAAKVNKRKQTSPNRSFPTLKTFAIRKAPGEKAAEEIRRLRKTTKLIIEKEPFKRLVKEITTEVSGTEFRHSADAIEALQESAEAFLVGFFEDVSESARINGRQTIERKDVQLVRFLQKW